MRMLLKVTIPAESGNAAIKDGRLPRVIEGALDQLRPESAYFGPEGGKRAAWLVFDLKDPSQIPVVAERWFSEVNAELQMTPVMSIDDLRKGLQQIGVKK